MTRAEKVTEAQRLRSEGLKLREIAERMGTAQSTVAAWLSDPDLSKQCARRERYGGVCSDCGARTDGSKGPGRAPTRCSLCQHRYERENAHWSRDRIVEAVQRWAGEHGVQPSAEDWQADHEGYPSLHTVQRVFGAWSVALEAAGFKPYGRYVRKVAA